MARAAAAGEAATPARASGVRRVGGAMIVLFNPLSTTPGKQPLPLSVMSLAAVLEKSYAWTLVDGNVCTDPAGEIVGRLARASPSAVSGLAVPVRPGPQLPQARRLR